MTAATEPDASTRSAADPIEIPRLLGPAARFTGSILLGMLAGIVLQFWTAAFLGWLGPDALYIRSIYAPVGFLTLAVTEGLVVATQISAGVATRNGRRAEALRVIPTFLGAGAAVLALTTLVFAVGSGPFLSALHVAQADRGAVVAFVVAFTLCSIVALVPYLIGAVLRGIGRPGLSSVLGVAFTVLSVVGMLACEYLTGLGALSAPLGGLLAIVLVGLVGVVLLRRCGLTAPAWRPRRDALGQVWMWAMPVAGTFLLLTTVTFGYLRVLRNAGAAQIAAFNLGQTATACFMVGAFAVGSGAAIAVTMVGGEQRRAINERGMWVALRLALPAYLVLGALAYLLREPLCRLLTSDPTIAAHTADYLAWVGPTFILFGGSLALLTYLEQIGHARAAFLLNLVYFAAVLTAAVALRQPVGSTTLAQLLAASNVIGFGTLLVSTRYLIRRT